MERSILLYPLGNIAEYKEVTYIYGKDKIKSAFPVRWICDKLGGVEKVAFIITKKLKNDHLSLFDTLAQYLTGKDLASLFGENWVRKFVKDFEKDKETFSQRLQKEINLEISFIVIDESYLPSFIVELRDFIEENLKYILHIDITHGYRFIPMFLTIVISLLENANMPVRIGRILYAYGESNTENRVIDLRDYLEVLRWSQMLYTFRNTGNIRPIGRAMRYFSKSLMEKLNDLQSSLDMNFSQRMKTALAELKEEIGKTNFDSLIVLSLVKKEIMNLIDEFKVEGSRSDFELSIAKWHLRNGRYLNGYTALIEALITRICEAYGLDASSREGRESARAITFLLKKDSDNQEYREFIEKNIIGNEELKNLQMNLALCMKYLSEIRNCFAHMSNMNERAALTVYFMAVNFAKGLDLKELSEDIEWSSIDDVLKNIDRLPSLFSLDNLKKFADIFKSVK